MVVRRSRNGACLATLLMLAGCGGSSSGPTPPPTTAPTPPPVKPSIVVVIADDMEWNTFGVLTRTISQIGDQGVTFTNSFVATPLCAPSRATLFSGRYAHNHGIRGNGGFPEIRDLGIEASSLAPWLKAAGYRTALFGKYENNYPRGEEGYIPPGWDTWWGVFEDRAATQFDYTVNDNGAVLRYKGGAEVYQTDVLGDKAAAFVRAAPADQPVFMLLGVAAPHAGVDPAPRHEGMFSGSNAPRGPAFNEADTSDKPNWVKNIPLMTSGQIANLDDLYRTRLQSLQAVDEMVVKLLDALQATNRLGQTYFFVTSDNGLLMGQHRLQGGKNSAYEESISIPLIVRGPGVPAGRKVPHIVGNIDLAPTFLAIAGASIPASVDGRSLVPLLGATPPAQSEWRKDLLIESLGGAGGTFGDEGTGIKVPPYNAIRQAAPEGELLYVEYTTNNNRELYDMRLDGAQLDNSVFFADAATLQKLSQRVAALVGCSGATCQ